MRGNNRERALDFVGDVESHDARIPHHLRRLRRRPANAGSVLTTPCERWGLRPEANSDGDRIAGGEDTFDLTVLSEVESAGDCSLARGDANDR